MLNAADDVDEAASRGDQMLLPGIVTVFATTTCPYCKAAIALLESKSVKIRVWELDLYPSSALLEVRGWTEGATSVPQIFFNAQLLRGGNSQLQALEGAGRLDDVLTASLAEPCEEEDLPRLTSAPLASSSSSSSTGEEVDSSLSPWGFAGLPRGTVEETELREFYQRLRVTLGGNGSATAVFSRDVLRQHSNLVLNTGGGESADADAVWERLVDYGVIVPYSAAATTLYYYSWLSWLRRPSSAPPMPYYTFSQDRHPHVLNVVFDNTQRKQPLLQASSSSSALVLASRLHKHVGAMLARYSHQGGRAVDFAALRDADEYALFVDLTHELQLVNLRDLFVDTDRKAFFLNLYNALALHGQCELGQGALATAASRAHFFTYTSYRIGGSSSSSGALFSLNDMEHGVLRGNRANPGGFLPFFRGTPYSSLPVFSEDDDERYRYALLPMDCRIHFALNCGARSCPAVAVYSAHGVDAELDAAARAYCEEGVSIDSASKRITLAMLFKWYAADFGDTARERLERIALFLSPARREQMRELLLAHHTDDDSFDIHYSAYDWTSINAPLTL